jgi:hypothetical protein
MLAGALLRLSIIRQPACSVAVLPLIGIIIPLLQLIGADGRAMPITTRIVLIQLTASLPHVVGAVLIIACLWLSFLMVIGVVLAVSAHLVAGGQHHVGVVASATNHARVFHDKPMLGDALVDGVLLREVGESERLL